MAMNLLTAVQSNPNLPVEFRTVAISVANNAITFANQEIARQATTTIPQVVVSTPEPVQEQPVGGIIIPMENENLNLELEVVKNVIYKQAGENKVPDFVDVEVKITNGSNGLQYKIEGHPRYDGGRLDTVRPPSRNKKYNSLNFSANENKVYTVIFQLDGKTQTQQVNINEL